MLSQDFRLERRSEWLADTRGSGAMSIAARHGLSFVPRLATMEARVALEEALERLAERVRDGAAAPAVPLLPCFLPRRFYQA